MSTQIDDRIEQDLREAFHAAAAAVHPDVRLLPGTARTVVAEHHTRTRRWLMPAVAAAVAAAIGLPLLAFTLLRGASGPDIQAASVVTESGDRATVAGVSFPMPDGWTAKTVAHTDTAVTVCVAAHPSAHCDGVTLGIALPNVFSSITPVADPITTAETDCPGTHSKGLYPELVDQKDVGGRPAVHYAIGCGPTGPRSAGWFVTDGSLAICTPRGKATEQAEQIARGIDFSGYHHSYGPQVMFLSEPGSASTHSAAGTSDRPEPTR